MNEPTHPHFVLSDGQYCHVLEDRLYVGKRDLPKELPPPENKLDAVSIILFGLGLLIMLFFAVTTIITKYYVVTFTTSALGITLAVAFFRAMKFTATKTIYRGDILGVEYHKRAMGYDYFIVHYAGKDKKAWKRRLTIYDSQQCLEQALQVMKNAGILQ